MNAPVVREALTDRYRVMLVDDSAVIRGLMARWMSTDPSIEVVASVANGLVAVQQIERANPDVVVLDIEMPEMDGLTALPKLLAIKPDVKIVMSSTLTLRNADISIKALGAGAADYIPKPTSTREMSAAASFQRELIEKIKALGAARRKQSNRGLPRSGRFDAAVAARLADKDRAGLYGSAPIVLRKVSLVRPRILVIGSSTGGPQALFHFFGQIKDRVHLPILITQHMPPNFTTILAEHLHRVCGLPCAEGIDGAAVSPKRVYVAPGDWHMTVTGRADDAKIKLNRDPPENYCRPAVDPMFRSVAQVYGAAVLAVVLTGMGQDGMRGGQALIRAGGTVIAQDEATSVVWGMPGAAATAGICAAVLPLNDIAPRIQRIVQGAAQ